MTIGPFVAKLWESGEASKAAATAIEEDRKAVLELADAQGKSLVTAEREQALTVGRIKSHLDAAVATREHTKALLEQAIAQAKIDQERSSAPGTRGELGSLAAAESSGRVSGLEQQLADNTKAMDRLQKGFDLGFSKLVGMKINGDDRRATVERQYTAARNEAIRKYAGDPAGEAKRLREIDRIHTRELKSIEDEAKARDGSTRALHEFGRTVTSAQAASIARSAGFQVNSGNRTFAEQKRLYDSWVAQGRPADNPTARPGTSAHERGNALDIQASAGVTVKKIRDAFAAEGVRLTKVITERGHWHVEWAPTAEERASTREAAKEVRQLDADLAAITQRFDPARAAADEFAETLSKIADLEAAHKITGGQALDYTLKAKFEFDAAETKRQLEGFRQTVGPAQFDADVARFDNPSLRDDAEQAIREGADYAADRWRDAFGDIADMFGIRITGPLSNLLSPGGIQGRADQSAHELIGGLADMKLGISDEALSKLEHTLGGVLQGAAYGQIGRSVFSALGGGKGSGVGSALGGIAGQELGKMAGPAIAQAIGGTLDSTLGNLAGPLGSIAGGILGSAIGGLFSKSTGGNAAVSGGRTTTYGSSADLRSGAAGMAGDVDSSIARIADQLGATIGRYDLSIGTFNGKYRVRDSAFDGRYLDFKGKSAQGLHDFGDDQQAAIAYAVKNALQDGVLTGISQAAQNILKGSSDLEAAITKAVLIESVPRDLKSMLDPVGAAVDDLNRRFAKTVAALKEGGASTAELAQAEQLYNLQLAEVKASTASASQGLKDFITDLKLGSDSPYSLRDQEATAMAQLKPYLDTINGGGRVQDQAAYQKAAQTYLDIERQIYGSGEQYFAAIDKIQAATNKAIATIDNAVPITPGVDSPFAKATADSAAATASNTAAGNQISADTNQLLQRLIGAVQQLQKTSSVPSGFIGTTRAFAA